MYVVFMGKRSKKKKTVEKPFTQLEWATGFPQSIIHLFGNQIKKKKYSFIEGFTFNPTLLMISNSWVSSSRSRLQPTMQEIL